MADRAECRQPLGEAMFAIGLQFAFRQQQWPVLGRGDQGGIVESIDVGSLDRAAIRIVALEVGGIDQNLLDHTGMTEFQDRPIEARFAATTSFPAVTHVDATIRRDQVAGLTVVGIVAGDRSAAVGHGGQIEPLAARVSRPVDRDPTVQTQPGHSAVGKDVQPDVGADSVISDREPVVAVAMQAAARQQWPPVGFRAGAVAAIPDTAVQRRLGRVVAGEVAGIDIDTEQPSGGGQPNDAPIMTGTALASAFPAIHPLAVIVVHAGLEDRLVRLDQALARREEFIAGSQCDGTQARLGQVDAGAGEFGRMRVVWGAVAGHEGLGDEEWCEGR